MNPARLALAFLRRRWGQAVLAILIGALAVAAIETILIAERDIPRAAKRAFGGVDLVIGPKGSALDLVFCCVLHVSAPRGLVPLESGLALTRNPLVRTAAPLALGDNIRGWRIVGTTTDILSLYGASFADGGKWTAPLQAVLGSNVAVALGLKVGDSFVGAHGLGAGGEEHSEFPYKVVGTLKPTGSALDRLVLTDLASVYEIHRHHEAEEAAERGAAPAPESPLAVNAILVAFRSPIALASLPRLIDATPQFASASPSLEAARLIGAARPVIVGSMMLALIFGGIAAATAATALMTVMSTRAKDLALLRVLGAHPWELARIALIEAVILAIAAVAVGALAAAGLVWFGSNLLAAREGLILEPVPAVQDLALIFGGGLIAAVIAAMIPAARAARASIEEVMSA